MRKLGTGRLSRGAAIAIALALLAGDAAAQTPEAPAGNPQAPREAVALMIDNQARISKLADRQADLLASRGEPAQVTEEIDHYIRIEARIDVQAAWNTLSIAKELIADFSPDLPDSARQAVSEMLRAQETLYDLATTTNAIYSASEYRLFVNQQTSTFQAALRSLPPGLKPSYRERQAAMAKHRDQIFFGRGAGVGGESVVERPISAAEYAKKKEEYDDWMADQKRREEELRQKKAALRETRQERRENMEERELPKLALEKPQEHEGPSSDPEEMKAWHTGYADKVLPVKQSLAQYLQVLGPMRTEIMLRACQDLSRKVTKFLEDETILSAPDETVARALRLGFEEIRSASSACIADRLQVARTRMAAGQKALGQAAAALKPYSLGL